MDSNYIEQLLERYWQCETSVEEEAQLRSFFRDEDVPAHLLRYRDLFLYQEFLQQEGLGDDFDQKVLAQIEVPVVKARRMTLASRFMPLLKAVAMIVLMFSLGNVMQHSVFDNNVGGGSSDVPDTIEKQMSAPSVALSGNPADSHEKELMDSLARVDEKMEIEKR
ncbi:hypothetical protein [uncultured Bacteroides sp.]|uniref:hypothetical protein n=1 Tax=uncultured Bacteroides sp. TaxID=162156 RepID=UPI002622CD36|nr:hypothetical protein [uncultured Bacteroides sp.]